MAEHEQFEEFAVRGSRALERMAFLLTGDAHLAEDLIQTTLAKAWERWSRIDGDPLPYVRAILVSEATSWRARRWTGEVPHDELPDVVAPANPERLDLQAALLTLPARQRACVVLRFVEDLSEQQTAAALGCSVGNVKSQTSRALAKLREHPRIQIEEVTR